MKDLILGYGYTGQFIANYLNKMHRTVIAMSRHKKNAPNVIYQQFDADYDNFLLTEPINTLFYCLPPQSEGTTDTRLTKILSRFETSVNNIVYISSSGVYGDHQGKWVYETSPCRVKTPRQKRRLHAENSLLKFCQDNNIPLAIFRTAGIYGPGRTPIEKARRQSALIKINQAPCTNLVFVKDLATLAVEVGDILQEQQIFNISDGVPVPWGHSQRILASHFNMPPAPEVDFDSYYQQSSSMVQSFLDNAKKLSNQKIKQFLPKKAIFTELETGLLDSL